MKKISFIIIALFLSLGAFAQVELNNTGRETSYVSTIVNRSQKIVDQLGINDPKVKQNVLNIIANRYFLLNDINDGYETQADKLKKDETLSKADKQRMQADLQNGRDAQLYLHHFEYESTLSNYLNEKQIEQVKDGMTYGVLMVTYNAYLDMIPSLKPSEKVQIKAWLHEAREFAMDAGDSKAKHAWFGKYKGRINNWLSKIGYDITKERQDWQKRIDAKKKK